MRQLVSLGWRILLFIDSKFYDFVAFDEEDYSIDLIQNDAEAYDENLDACVERAMSTTEIYQEMRLEIEKDVIFLRDQIEKVVQFLDRVHERTVSYAQINGFLEK